MYKSDIFWAKIRQPGNIKTSHFYAKKEKKLHTCQQMSQLQSKKFKLSRRLGTFSNSHFISRKAVILVMQKLSHFN